MRTTARGILASLVLATAAGHAACARMDPLDRGLTLFEQGRWDAAHRAFDDAVRLSPDGAAAWNNRGLARLRMGQLAGALGDLTQAMELAPTDPEVAFNRGNVYMTLGTHDRAIQDFNRAVLLQPAYARAYFNRGTAQFRRGDPVGADADWRYAARLEPDPAVRLAMLESAGLARGFGSPTVAAFAGSAPDAPALLAMSSAFSARAGEIPAAPGMAPPPAPGEVPPSALPALTEAPRPDATELALRGVSRELAGDHAGAVADLRDAVRLERDPGRRAAIEGLLRGLEGVR